jgi:ABC-type uncharacterized transport system substrate-binding protein
VERRTFVIVSTLNLFAAGASWAQEPAKNSRVGIITSGGNPRSAAFFVAFEERLRELGWVDGKNLSVDFEAGESPEQLSAIATRMVQHRVDVIVAVGPERALKAASEATHTIPIVSIALNYDPVEKGYVISLARPGRNINGNFCSQSRSRSQATGVAAPGDSACESGRCSMDRLLCGSDCAARRRGVTARRAAGESETRSSI